MIQSGQNFAHVIIVKLSPHMQICDLVGLLESKQKQKEIT